MSALVLEVEVHGKLHRVALERKGDSYLAHIDGRIVPVDLCEPMPGVLSLLIGEGETQRSYRCIRTIFAEEETIALIGSQHRVAVTDPRSLRAQRKGPGAGNGAVQIKSSMPGRVARVLVASGDEVDAQQGIVVVEAMKMQNELKSPKSGKVQKLLVAEGATVNAGDTLAVIE
jgi:biotin carboxyl carrier protein